MKKRRRKIARAANARTEKHSPTEQHEQGKHTDKAQDECESCFYELLHLIHQERKVPAGEKYKDYRPKREFTDAQEHIVDEHLRNHHEGRHRDDCAKCLWEWFDPDCKEREINLSNRSSNDIERSAKAVKLLEDSRDRFEAIENIVLVDKEFRPLAKDLFYFNVVRQPNPLTEARVCAAALKKANGQGFSIFVYWDRLAFFRAKLEERRTKGDPADGSTKKIGRLTKNPILSIAENFSWIVWGSKSFSFNPTEAKVMRIVIENSRKSRLAWLIQKDITAQVRAIINDTVYKGPLRQFFSSNPDAWKLLFDKDMSKRGRIRFNSKIARYL